MIGLIAHFTPPNTLPSGDEAAGVIYPIGDEHTVCHGCTGEWDNWNTGAFCRYGQVPGVCRGPKG